MSRLNSTQHKKKYCIYCTKQITDDNYLHCLHCLGDVHIKCLQHASTPGDILGDIFYDFTCANCTTPGEPHEKLVRRKLSWLLVVTLAIYNLSIKSKGLSHHGYFHWRTHIISFIDKNWNFLFAKKARQRKHWTGSVSGILSHNSPEYFLSGQEVFQEAGWWKLAHANQTPRCIHKLYEQQVQKRQQKRKERLMADENSCSSDVSSNDAPVSKQTKQDSSIENYLPEGCCSRSLPFMGRKPKIATQLNIIDDDMSRQQQQPLNSVQSSLMDFLAESLGGDDLNMFNSLPSIAPEPLGSVGKPDFLMSPTLLDVPAESLNFFDVSETLKPTTNDLQLTPNDDIHGKLRSLYADQLGNEETPIHSVDLPISDNSNDTRNDNESEEDDNEAYEPRVIQVTNFQQINEIEGKNQVGQLDATLTNIKLELKSEEDATSDNEIKTIRVKAPLETCKPSLFKKEPCRKWPWLVEPTSQEESAEDLTRTEDTNEPVALSNERLTHMSLYEEQQLHQKLQKIYAFEQQNQIKIPAYVRRFYRKLCVRKWKREHNRPIFNLDDYIDPNGKPVPSALAGKTQILDRYQLIALSSNNSRKSFYARITGSSEYEMFESPYTQRILHPFIFRSETTFPPWLKLMCDVKHRVTGVVPERAPIDYCYVRPYHIAAVNALLQTAFWPGIDMSECLSYPDYSVVALYRKLVVGCGFLVPDVGYNEAYISFMAVRSGWQRSGIATFMLYHLIQTCMTKDITLHVSATNPAVMLYQKFGFKIEEIILDFYEKYLPIDSCQSRHALFLRLMR